MKKNLAFAAVLIAMVLLYFSGTDQRNNNTIDPMLIPSISNICGEESKAWRLPYSLDLPHAEDIPGGSNPDTLIAFLQNKADDFSWRTFIAINWPADDNGSADSSVCFAGTRGRSVWEFWMPANELYVEPGKKPNSWKTGESFWHERPKNGGKISEMRLVGKIPPHMTVLNAEDFPVIDDDSNYTLYEIFYNRSAYDYVVQSGLNTVAGQQEFVQSWPSYTSGLVYVQGGDTLDIEKRFQRAYFPVGNYKDSVREVKEEDATYIFTIGEGAMIIKSGWRVLVQQNDHSKYHTREVKLENGQKYTLGLVAMHIAHKVAEATQWVWSTFEHAENAPTIGENGIAVLEPGVDYVYFLEDDNDPQTYNRHASNDFQADPEKRLPSQVVNLTESLKSTDRLNDQYHKMLRDADPESVWLNYRLVGTQWPSNPQLFTAGAPYQPAKLTNSLMETYHQQTSSCMGCHSKAKFGKIEGREGFQYNADFIFGLSGAR